MFDIALVYNVALWQLYLYSGVYKEVTGCFNLENTCQTSVDMNF